MIVKNEPYLIEYNVRMGDPKCQTILPKLKTDLVEILKACCNEKLSDITIEWTDEKVYALFYVRRDIQIPIERIS